MQEVKAWDVVMGIVTAWLHACIENAGVSSVRCESACANLEQDPRPCRQLQSKICEVEQPGSLIHATGV